DFIGRRLDTPQLTERCAYATSGCMTFVPALMKQANWVAQFETIGDIRRSVSAYDSVRIECEEAKQGEGTKCPGC
ncbi:MAG: hypothetical protein WAV18_29760, partial [Roseiarcus sp.]